jgi:hypothetical protein
MSKRLWLGIVALGALPLLATESSATTCLSWRNIGGSNCCTKWSTSSILLGITLNQNCGTAGEGCDAEFTANTSNSIAFCQPSNLSAPLVRTTCTSPVTFSGSVSPPYTCTLASAPTCSGLGDACPNGKGDCCAGLTCVDNSATDHTKVCKGSGSKLPHGQSCTSSGDAMSLGNCQSACDTASPGSTIVDVVPIDMNTEVQFTVPTGGGGGGAATTAAAQSSFACPDFSSTCVIDQHCVIGANAIQYQAIKEYSCTVTFVGATAPPPTPTPTPNG